MNNNIDIKSTTIEKGLEIAKNFIDKLIMPSVEETGLLVKDNISMWRFKRQIKMLNNAKEYCLKNNIETKTISFKLLCPLLEYSSLEENDDMLDKWSILLSNMIDSEQNIENHVLPYLLSQLSINEFDELNKLYEKYLSERQNAENIFINKIKQRIDGFTIEDINKVELNYSDKEEYLLWKKIYRSRCFSLSDMEFSDIEESNLTRLGLIGIEKDYYSEKQTIEVPINKNRNYFGEIEIDDYSKVEFIPEIDSIVEYYITSLGEILIKCCSEKK